MATSQQSQSRRRTGACRAMGLAALTMIAATLAAWAETEPAPPRVAASAPTAVRLRARPIEGFVFRDANGNGLRDPGEPGIPNVGVSDGGAVVRTDSAGRYRLADVDPQALFVFVSAPAGYRKGGDFWRSLESASTTASLDFALAPFGGGDRFSFVHLSDTHVGRPGIKERLQAVFADVARLEPRPLFIAITGDLVEDGRIEEQYVDYCAAVKTSSLPVLHVAGNHDVLRSPANFHKHLGPQYYSFDEGRFHFIVMTNFERTLRYLRWLEDDRAFVAKGKPLILLQHYEPKNDECNIFDSWRASLLCHGHWHDNRIVTHWGLTALSTATPLFGGIDASPPGFHVVEVDGERLSATRRLSFQNRRLAIVSPSDDLIQTGPDLRVIANAYNTSRPPTSGIFELRRGNAALTTGALVGEGDWTWSARLNAAKLAPGPYEIAVTMNDGGGQPWSAQRRFELSAEQPPTPTPGNEDWPTFLGNAQRNRQPSAVIRPPLALSWVAPTGAPSEHSAPVLADGTIYVSLRNRGFPGNNGVLALDALTGARKWFAATESGVHNSVAVDSATVYASAVGGRTYAFDARNGHELWHVDHSSDHLRWVYQSPLVLGDRLVAGNAAYFSIIDRADGRELRHTGFHTDWMPTFGSFAASSQTLLACADWAKVGLAALNVETNRPLWGLAVYGCMATPVIAGDRVYVADVRGAVHCLPLGGGKPFWSRAFQTMTRQSPAAVASPAVASDRLIVAIGNVTALDRRTSEVLWQFAPDPPAGGYDFREISTYFSSPVVSGDLVWIGSGTGYLYALDLQTGRRVSRIEFGVPILSTPLVWGNSIYVATYDGHLYCLTER